MLNNSFTVGTVSVEVDEELDGNTKKNVTIKNTGSSGGLYSCDRSI